ncbi:MAG: hypothetical protein ACREDY_10650 [Bradyrhizobium sp.]
MSHAKLSSTLLTCSLCAAALCSTSTHAANAASTWIANGGTACNRFLTPDVVGKIFKNPAGESKKSTEQGCRFETPDFAMISITLTAGGPAVLDAHMKYLDNPLPLSGVGDKAVRTRSGIEAVKGNDRMCGIDVMPPFGNKISGEALALELGAICNKLFALP